MLNYDFDESPGYWLLMAHQAYVRAFNERLSPHGITFRQAQVLGWLAIDGPQSQAELASKMLIEPPSLVGVLDRMEQSGLIERRPCPDDRRKNQVHPLPAAERVFQRIADCGRLVREQALEGLSDSEVATLKRLLSTLRQNVSSLESLPAAS